MGGGEVCLAVANDGDMGDENSSRIKLKRDCQWVADDNESEVSPNKKQLKEASNEDVCSEVSNPNLSPKEIASSFQAITSQEAELARSNQGGCGETTSTCSGNSSSENSETLSDEEHSRNDTSDAVPMSDVILEIPKHASSSGIRKITFKFSKSKEDYDNRLSAAVAQPATNWVGSSFQEECGVNYSAPSNVKKLLSTGILEGARVKYISISQEEELCGIVKGCGYLCGCLMCDFSIVLSAYEFEQHAGGFKTRHPNNHIYLENGNPIYSIIQKLKTAPSSLFDEVIRDVAGSSVNEEFLPFWKASLRQRNGMDEVDKVNNFRLPSRPHSLASCPSHALDDRFNPTSCSFLQSFSFKQQRYTRETPEGQKRVVNKRFSKSVTRRRDNDLHRILFLPNGLPDGADLAYYAKGKKILGGYKQGNGIVCSCCDREVSPSQFEAHAGWSARRQPYRHIYTSNGLTLHDIAISLSNGQNLTTGDSDDMCAVCGDGGDLVLCNGCPRAFHTDCLDSRYPPEGDWHCPHCQEKFGFGRKAVAGEGSSIARPMVIRLTRVVKAPEFQVGGCVVCRAHDFSVATFDDRTIMLCDQCEKEFHVGCLRDSGLCDLKELPKDKWFCCDDCNKIHVALQNLVYTGAELVPASLLSTVNRKLIDKGYTDVVNDVQWRILSGKSRYPEHLPYLSRAAAIFRECFDPIVAKSGRDLIPVMVYGRNISGQEFGGMYCIVLIVKSVVVSAGLLRVFGHEVAELPIVATSREHQGKGYFQALFSCIERLLCSMNVENLVLPAAEDAESIWTKKLGFQKMSEARLWRYTRFQLTSFKGTSMLEKPVQRKAEY